MNNNKSEIEEEKKLVEYIIDRILKGYVFFLGNEYIVKIQEKESNVKFERTDINVKLRQYNKESKLYFIKKDEKLKNYSSDVYIPAGANWETLFGFYFEEDMPIKVHVYFIGREFDLDKLSEMVYSLFTDIEKNYIKINKIAFKYGEGVKPNKNVEKAIIEDIKKTKTIEKDKVIKKAKTIEKDKVIKKAKTIEKDKL